MTDLFVNSKLIETTILNNTLRVVNKTNSVLQLSIYNINGCKIMDLYLNSNSVYEKQLLNVNGYYILKCISEDGLTQTMKFISIK